MSVQAMAWVFEHSDAEGTDRLVLLSIANHAGASPVDGAWEAYPGIERIRQEARLSRSRTVQESLARLEAQGRVERVINGAPDSRIRADKRPNLYRILTEPRGDVSRHPDEPERGDASRHHGVPSHGTQTISEPSPIKEPVVNSHQPRGEPDEDEPEIGDPQAEASKALAEAARRRARTRSVSDPQAYERTVLAHLRSEFGHEALRLAGEGWRWSEIAARCNNPQYQRPYSEPDLDPDELEERRQRSLEVIRAWRWQRAVVK